MTKPRLVIGASAKNENILWATKFFAPDPFVFLEVGGTKIIVVDKLEYDRALKEARVDIVLLNSDFSDKKVGKTPPLEEQAFLLLKKYGVSSFTVSRDFPAFIYHFLSENGLIISFEDPLFPERAIKTTEELEDIRYAQRCMEDAFSIILALLEKAEIRGVELFSGNQKITSEMLRTIFDTELMKRNCICEATIIASGDQATDPHCMGLGPILANSPIIFDMFPRSRRKWYWSDMTRTVAKGRISSEARKMYETVREIQMAAVEMVKPGVDGYDIHNSVVQEFKKLGFETGQINDNWQGFFHGTGHGVGLEIHEPPRISSSRGKGQILQPGNVVTIEPGLYYKGIGGVRIEDTLYVTEDGHENLAKTTKNLIELP